MHNLTLLKFLVKKSSHLSICGWVQGREIDLHPNGKLRSIFNYLNDEMHDVQYTLYENGQLKSKFNKNDKKLGFYFYWCGCPVLFVLYRANKSSCIHCIFAIICFSNYLYCASRCSIIFYYYAIYCCLDVVT